MQLGFELVCFEPNPARHQFHPRKGKLSIQTSFNPLENWIWVTSCPRWRDWVNTNSLQKPQHYAWPGGVAVVCFTSYLQDNHHFSLRCLSLFALQVACTITVNTLLKTVNLSRYHASSLLVYHYRSTLIGFYLARVSVYLFSFQVQYIINQ